MAKLKMDDLLKQRMGATQRAPELQVSEEACEKLFDGNLSPAKAVICELPMDKLVSFFTADIGFRPYPPNKLNAFAQQLAVEGLLERILVRPIPGSDSYEILLCRPDASGAMLCDWW